MISLVVYRNGRNITGFELSGHSGFAEKGSDIVCAAVSGAAGLVECAVTGVLKLKADTKIDPENALFHLRLSDTDASKPECRALLDSFFLHMKAIRQEYPQNIKISEVQTP